MSDLIKSINELKEEINEEVEYTKEKAVKVVRTKVIDMMQDHETYNPYKGHEKSKIIGSDVWDENDMTIYFGNETSFWRAMKLLGKSVLYSAYGSGVGYFFIVIKNPFVQMKAWQAIKKNKWDRDFPSMIKNHK